VQNVALTITTTLEEAVSRMQLQLNSLPMKRWRKCKSAGGNRRLQDAQKHAQQISLDEVAGGGLANSRCRVATCFRTLRHSSLHSGSNWSRMVCADGARTRPDYLVNRVDKKN